MKTDWDCLKFTQTAGWAERDRTDDELTNYDALVAWAEREGALDSDEAERLRRSAAQHLSEAAAVLEAAVSLRDIVYRIFSAIGRDEAPAEADVQALNDLLPEASARLGIVRTDEGYDWGWVAHGETPLDRVLWPIIRSAGDLLTWPQLQRVKLCAADDCGWLFIDASRNRSRRWCDMSDCGNRAKAKRFRERHT